MSERFEIARLGSQGDGVADTGAGPVFVPFTLPGEMVTAARARDRADLIAIERSSPLRIEPACRHFGVCGNCVMQHLETQAYRDWKRGLVVQALKSQGVDFAVADLVASPPQSRRRAAFTARKTDAGVVLGYHRALSHDLFDMEQCPVLLPSLVEAGAMIRQLAFIIGKVGAAFRLLVTATASGFDVAAFDCGRPTERVRHLATDFVTNAGIARLSIDGEIIVEPRKPVVMFGEVAVAPPPGAFLQASAFAEETMADLVGAHLSRSKKIADLFAGCGSFALRLARKAEVHAVESDAASLAALDRAARFATGLRRVVVERRDLFRRPLTFKELNAFDGIVFDPPRAGAEDQSRQIARSDVPLVAAVSCNPATLARDLAILTGGGYAVKSITPIDQFLWSAHAETVALLEKPKRRR